MSKKRRPEKKVNASIVDERSRFPAIDALRGIALIAMFVYHFSFDLSNVGLIQQDFYVDPVWIGSRTLILSSFLLLAGMSLALSNRNGIRWPAVRERLAQVAGCAALVSIGSYSMFPQSWIYFGVLHHIAVASLLGLLFLRFGWMNVVLGGIFIGLGAAFEAPLFDLPLLQWIGLMTHKPVTEDYVPLLPWFGVVLLGIFLGKRFLSAPCPRMKGWQPANGATRLLTFAGRHSLLFYMGHQPVFIGLIYLFLQGWHGS